MAFKMKGSPMQRNFGVSPIKDIQGDGTLQGTNHHHNNKHYDGMKHDKDGNWIEEAKPAPKFKSALKQQVLGGMRRTKPTKELKIQKTVVEKCRDSGGTWDPKTKTCIPKKD